MSIPKRAVAFAGLAVGSVVFDVATIFTSMVNGIYSWLVNDLDFAQDAAGALTAIPLLIGWVMSIVLVIMAVDEIKKWRREHSERKAWCAELAPGVPAAIRDRIVMIKIMEGREPDAAQIDQLCSDTVVYFQGKVPHGQVEEFAELLDNAIGLISDRREIVTYPRRFANPDAYRRDCDTGIAAYCNIIAKALQRSNVARMSRVAKLTDELNGRLAGDRELI